MERLVPCSFTTLFAASLVFVGAGFLGSCPPAGSNNGGPGIRVTYGPTLTRAANGQFVNSDLVGRKRVSATVELRPGDAFLPGGGAQVFYTLPGDSERSGSATLVGGTTNQFAFEIVNSELADVCEKILYRWTVVYDLPDSDVNGVFIGEQRTIMSATKDIGNGRLEQALCAE